MAAIHWLNAINGSFTNPSDWSGGTVPGASDDATLDAAGSAFTVTSGASETVESVQLVANATLAITGGTFAATGGTGNGANAGTVLVTNGAQFVVGGAIDNAGGVTLTAASMFLETDTTLSGAGVCSLVNVVAANASIGGAARVSLTNVDETIQGNGVIGATSGFHLINEAGGVIEATDKDRSLTLGKPFQPGLLITNLGVLQSAGGILTIYDAKITGQGGRLGPALLIDCTVTGQTLIGGLQLEDSDVRTHGGVLSDFGIRMSGGRVTLEGATTLTGGGDVYMNGGGALVGANAGVSLTNADSRIRIFGGYLGGGAMSLTNQAAGYITGYGRIDTGTNTILNDGTISAYGAVRGEAAPLVIAGAIDNTGALTTGYDGGGSLIVEGAVTGAGQLTIRGSLRGGGLGDFESDFDEDVTFVRVSHTNHNFSKVSVLELAKSQEFTASITGFSTKGRTALDLTDIEFFSAGEVTFSGKRSGGVLTVTDGTHTARITLIGDYRRAVFTASSDGHGGTTVVATRAGGAGSPDRLIAAMAGLGASTGEAIHLGQPWTAREAALVRPHAIA